MTSPGSRPAPAPTRSSSTPPRPSTSSTGPASRSSVRRSPVAAPPGPPPTAAELTPGAPPFHRDRFTWAAYGALLAFGFLNAVLGPILPYLRAVEHISYLGGALHQLAYAMGGGAAGLLARRELL